MSEGDNGNFDGSQMFSEIHAAHCRRESDIAKLEEHGECSDFDGDYDAKLLTGA